MTMVHVHAMPEDKNLIPRIRGMLGKFPGRIESGKLAQLCQRSSFHNILRIGPTSEFDLHVRAAECLCDSLRYAVLPVKHIPLLQVMENEMDPKLNKAHRSTKFHFWPTQNANCNPC